MLVVVIRIEDPQYATMAKTGFFVIEDGAGAEGILIGCCVGAKLDGWSLLSPISTAKSPCFFSSEAMLSVDPVGVEWEEGWSKG